MNTHQLEELSRDLWLEPLDPRLWDEARRMFIQGDGPGFAGCGYSNGTALRLVHGNVFSLQDAGIYEPALLHAYVGCRTNHAEWSLDRLRWMFLKADRAKLLAAGVDPGPGPFTLYRGVSGRARRRVVGYSWTPDVDVACWFACRFGLDDPGVYVAEVPRHLILAHVVERGEREYLCRPYRYQRLKLTPEEMAAGAERFKQARQAREPRLATV